MIADEYGIGDLSELVSKLSRLDARLIGIDGHAGVGKTTLAKRVAAKLNGTAIELDKYLTVKEQGKYVQYLNTHQLALDINSASAPVIVEGVCLLEALKLAGNECDILVYVKRRSAYSGIWHENDFHEPDPHNKFGELDEEIRAYNINFQPITLVDFIFEIPD